MKTILIIVGIILALGLCAFLLPAIIGIAAGIALFKSGHFVWAIITPVCIARHVPVHYRLRCSLRRAEQLVPAALRIDGLILLVGFPGVNDRPAAP